MARSKLVPKDGILLPPMTTQLHQVWEHRRCVWVNPQVHALLKGFAKHHHIGLTAAVYTLLVYGFAAAESCTIEEVQEGFENDHQR